MDEKKDQKKTKKDGVARKTKERVKWRNTKDGRGKRHKDNNKLEKRRMQDAAQQQVRQKANKMNQEAWMKRKDGGKKLGRIEQDGEEIRTEENK